MWLVAAGVLADAVNVVNWTRKLGEPSRVPEDMAKALLTIADVGQS
jgi:hypothetical protein